MFRVCSEQFDHTEPPRTTVMNGEAGLQGMFRVSSEQFDYTEPPRTTVMKWEACLQGRFNTDAENEAYFGHLSTFARERGRVSH